jgi:GPH family glycoside/pentoside/hexuronide:cation symporter
MTEIAEPASQQPASEHLGLTEKLSYGLGDLASCLYWQTFMAYLAIFYTDIFGIGALAAGTMIGISRASDAFFDPVMGMLADRTRTRWGKFRPFFIWMCVPMAVLGVLTFTVPHLAGSAKLVWAYVTYNALMLVYTAINIPYTALMGVITTNPLERTALSSIKYVGAFTGGMIIAATLLPMAKVGGWLGAQSVERGWQLCFVIYGIAACLCFTTMFFTTRERVVPPRTQKTSVARDLKDLLTNRPWLILVASTIAFILYVALRTSVTAHYFKYYVGSQTLKLPSFLPKSIAGTQTWGWETLVSVYNTCTQVASLVGVILMPFAARIAGRKVAFMVLMAIAICSTGSFFLLKPDQVPLMFGMNLLASITGGPIIALLMTMYADTADYGEWTKQRRATGLIFSASIFSQKQGWAVGAWVALALMSSVGFVANTAQTPESLHGLVLLMSILPAGIGIVSMVILMFYPLHEAKMAEIEVELKKRRAADGVESTIPA